MIFSHKRYVNIIITLILGTGLILYTFRSEAQTSRSEAQTSSESTSTTSEQIDLWLQEADAYVQREEFTAGYDIYLRILGLDPVNTHARTKIFELLHNDQTQLATAREQQAVQEVQVISQRYRNNIRDLLQVLTAQLKQSIERYAELGSAEKAGEDVQQEISLVLTTIIQILRDLTTLYEDYPQSEAEAANTQKIVERLKLTITKYQQELEQYQP
jgi:hypothetical protein